MIYETMHRPVEHALILNTAPPQDHEQIRDYGENIENKIEIKR